MTENIGILAAMTYSLDHEASVHFEFIIPGLVVGFVIAASNNWGGFVCAMRVFL